MRDLGSIIDSYYINYYRKVHGHQSKYSFLSFHKKIESIYKPQDFVGSVLELGSGQNEHKSFVKHEYNSYLSTDVREISTPLFSPLDPGVLPTSCGDFKSIADATDLKYPDESFDRVVTACLLLHLPDPLKAVDEWLRVLKFGGHIDALIPNYESLIVPVYQALFTQRKAKKLGFNDFQLVNALEHVTYYSRVVRLVSARYESEEVKFDHFPPVLGKIKSLRAYSVLRIIKTSA